MGRVEEEGVGRGEVGRRGEEKKKRRGEVTGGERRRDMEWRRGGAVELRGGEERRVGG